MIIITGNRASGKTYNLLNIASAQNIPILVGSEERRITLSEYAKRLGIKVDIVNVKTIDLQQSYIPKAAIDEIDTFLAELLGRVRIEITHATALGTVVNLSKSEEQFKQTAYEKTTDLFKRKEQE